MFTHPPSSWLFWPTISQTPVPLLKVALRHPLPLYRGLWGTPDSDLDIMAASLVHVHLAAVLCAQVLSVVAQQLLTIQNALKANLDKCWFEGRPIKLQQTCGVFSKCTSACHDTACQQKLSVSIDAYMVAPVPLSLETV
jgi:hypothetical protein